MNRRHAIALMSGFVASPAVARPGISLSMRNPMGESLTLRYHGHLSSLEHVAFNYLARDRRQDMSSQMDGRLIDILHGIAKRSGQGGTFTLLSGFRTRATNAILPGAAENSFHLRGQALDIHRDGMTVAEIGTITQQHPGGIGLYIRSGFVHLDTGPFRRWDDHRSGLANPAPSLAINTPDVLYDAFKF